MPDAAAAQALAAKLEGQVATRVLSGAAALADVASHEEVDTVMGAIVGAAGLASLPGSGACRQAPAAGQQGSAGTSAARSSWTLSKAGGGTLVPIDSEHSAIFQCLPEDRSAWAQRMDHIVLTASGGAPSGSAILPACRPSRRTRPARTPNWVMGRKISVDSATMMNKALEVIEARWLFDLPPRATCAW